MPPEPGLRGPARDWFVVLGAKAAASALVLLTGFRAVSDDDYARVVLSQGFAEAPRLDPTGTSWLPLPFWLVGLGMRVAGTTSLLAARVLAFALGLASALLLLAAARLLVRDRRAALAGALVACVFPWSARLGVATVPELPTAALSLFGLSTLASSRAGLRVAGGAALSAAALGRYEPWFLAVGFVAAGLFPRRLSAPLSRRAELLAAALALFGPAAWLVHNARAHGDALHFVARVSAYKRALGGDDPFAIVAYPLALLREEPELWLLLFVPALVRRSVRPPEALRGPLVALAGMVALLSVAAARGGAPTHHNGRAMLAVWLLVAVVLGAAGARILSVAGGARRAWLASLAVVLPLGVILLRPWYARLDSMAARSDEERLGARVAEEPPGAVLLEVRDYGYFAIQAASGSPARFVLDRTPDPRATTEPSSFRDEAALRERVRSTGARLVLGWESAATGWLGEPLAAAGALRLWRAPAP